MRTISALLAASSVTLAAGQATPFSSSPVDPLSVAGGAPAHVATALPQAIPAQHDALVPEPGQMSAAHAATFANPSPTHATAMQADNVAAAGGNVGSMWIDDFGHLRNHQGIIKTAEQVAQHTAVPNPHPVNVYAPRHAAAANRQVSQQAAQQAFVAGQAAGAAYAPMHPALWHPALAHPYWIAHPNFRPVVPQTAVNAASEPIFHSHNMAGAAYAWHAEQAANAYRQVQAAKIAHSAVDQYYASADKANKATRKAFVNSYNKFVNKLEKQFKGTKQSKAIKHAVVVLTERLSLALDMDTKGSKW